MSPADKTLSDACGQQVTAVRPDACDGKQLCHGMFLLLAPGTHVPRGDRINRDSIRSDPSVRWSGEHLTAYLRCDDLIGRVDKRRAALTRAVGVPAKPVTRVLHGGAEAPVS